MIYLPAKHLLQVQIILPSALDLDKCFATKMHYLLLLLLLLLLLCKTKVEPTHKVFTR